MTILLFDEIGGMGVTPDVFALELDRANGEAIEIRINSGGGSVFDGLAIYNLIKDYEGETKVIVDGLAASIASVIALGADKLVMNEGSFFMIHNPWTISGGESKDLRQAADILDKIQSQIVEIYAGATGKSEAEIIALMDAETWLNPTEALDMGFAQEIKSGLKIAAALKTKYIFNNIPKELISDMDEKEIKAEVAEVEVEVLEVVEAPEVEAEIEEIVAEVEVEIKAEAEIEAEVEEAPKAYSEEELKNAVELALSNERERQSEIKNLAFDGQEKLANSLIEEGISAKDAAARFINDAKENNLFAQAEAPKQNLDLLAFNNAAPQSFEDGSAEGDDELTALNKEWKNSTGAAAAKIMNKIVQLKKQA
jgi:ATP-dependent protease ClpP protease subunit